MTGTCEQCRALVARDPDELISVGTAARELCLTSWAIYKLIDRAKILKHTSPGQSWRYRVRRGDVMAASHRDLAAGKVQ